MSKSINQIRTQIFFVHMLLLRIVTSHLKQVVDLSSLHCRFEVTGAHSSKGRSDCKTFCNTGNILLKDLSTHSLELSSSLTDFKTSSMTSTQKMSLSWRNSGRQQSNKYLNINSNFLEEQVKTQRWFQDF